MDHKATLWPSIAAVVIVFMILFSYERNKEPEPVIPQLEFHLIEPGIPGLPPIPPVLPDKRKENLNLIG